MSDDLRDAQIRAKADALAKMYPNVTGHILEGWAEHIIDRNNDFKMPPTETMRMYSHFDELEKNNKTAKDGLRKEVIREFGEIDHPMEGITYRLEQRITVHEEELYNWVAREYPQYLTELTAKRIDQKLLEEKIAEGLMGLPDKSCYTEKPTSVVTVVRKKQ